MSLRDWDGVTESPGRGLETRSYAHLRFLMTLTNVVQQLATQPGHKKTQLYVTCREIGIDGFRHLKQFLSGKALQAVTLQESAFYIALGSYEIAEQKLKDA